MNTLSALTYNPLVRAAQSATLGLILFRRSVVAGEELLATHSRGTWPNGIDKSPIIDSHQIFSPSMDAEFAHPSFTSRYFE